MNIEGLADEAQRRAIRTELGSTLLVEAAAGTGKTTELVQRVMAVIASGDGVIGSIVAVTFTEKAAGEMKLRLRSQLERSLASGALSEVERPRVQAALGELEAARVGTIHGLCGDLLREHPVAAEVDPGFEVTDQARADGLLDGVFDRWFEAALDDPPEGVRRMLRRGGRGPGPRQQLLSAARRLVETRDFDCRYRRAHFDRRARIDEVLDRVEQLSGHAARALDRRDVLARALSTLARFHSDLEVSERASGRDYDQLEHSLATLLREVDFKRKGRGEAYGRGLSRADVLQERQALHTLLEGCVQACQADLAACLQADLWPVVEAYEASKRAEGVLDFFDLLMRTRDMLRRDDAVRQRLQQRFSHLFVDELQDTDPVQAEILLLLSADDDRQRDPWQVNPVAGKLFLVGDPKQSIYRFRRADMALYASLKERLIERGARLLSLTTSFRSVPAIQQLVNASFAPVMGGDVDKGQAGYVALTPFRKEPEGRPSVVALPVPSPYSQWGNLAKAAVNLSLPSAVGAYVHWLVTDSGWTVREEGQDVPLAARHICLLFRRFRDWDGSDVTRPYVRQLEARRVPHVLSGGRSFREREEVWALRAALTAIEHPDDELHVFATLRGPLFALSDEQLLAYKHTAGKLHPLSPQARDAAATGQPQVVRALSLLRRLHLARNRVPIAQTLHTLLHDTRAHAAFAIWPTGEQALGNVLKLVDMARAYERTGRASSFRGFVQWLSDERSAAGDTSDAPVLDDSSDGVRIMTVHAAKGLEFPVVVLCDPTAPRRAGHASRYVEPERKLWAQALCGCAPLELQEQKERVQDQDEAEVVRLTYVAATRARELLVVPAVGDDPVGGWVDVLHPALYPPGDARRTPQPAPGCPTFTGDSVAHRPGRTDRVPEESVAPGMHIPQAGDHTVVWWDPHALQLERPAVGGLRQQELLKKDPARDGAAEGVRTFEAWLAERGEVRDRSSQPSLAIKSVTRVSHEQEEVAAQPVPVEHSDGADSVRPGGKRFGNLVHGMLAECELTADRAQLSALAAMLARELGASEQEQQASVTRVEAALAHPLMERVRQSDDVRRETAVVLSRQEGQDAVEGIVDLAFAEGDGWVVVDFKTDADPGSQPAYAHQLRLYAQGMQQATGQAVQPMLFRV